MTVLAFPRVKRSVEGIIGGDESFSRIPLEQLAAAGITDLIRYNELGDSGPGGKGMSAAELVALLAACFRVVWVKETFEQAASLGYSQGIKEARTAFADADAIDWPVDRPGYFVAEDPYPIPRSAWPAVADYFRAVHDVDPNRPLQGAYGSGALCTYLAGLGLIAHQWHVSTWPGLDRDVADVVQEANGLHGYTNFGGAIDLNTIRDGNPDWGQHPFAPAPQPTQEDDIMYIFDGPTEAGGGIYVTDGDRAWGVSNEDYLNSFFFTGAMKHVGTLKADAFYALRDRDGKVRSPGVGLDEGVLTVGGRRVTALAQLREATTAS